MEKIKFKDYYKQRITDKAFTNIILVYLTLCFLSAGYFLFDLHIRNFCMSLAFTAFVPLIFLVEYTLRFRCGAVFTAGVLTLAFGSILGTCFDLYTTIPFFDLILHTLAGFLFGCLGFTLAERFFGKSETGRSFWGCVVFAVCFSLALAVVWELFEYACTVFFGFDMMEDCIVSKIDSYLLAGGHSETVTLDGIVKTVIYYGNGQTYTVEGYLDLGLVDTLGDMIVCTLGAALFLLTAALARKKCPKLRRAMIPQLCE